MRSTLGHSGKLICKNTAKNMVPKKEKRKRKRNKSRKLLTLFDILESWSKDDIEQFNSVLRAQERKQVIDKEDDHGEEDCP